MIDRPDDVKRVREIIKTFRISTEPITFEAIAKQFKYETKRGADAALIRREIERELS